MKIGIEFLSTMKMLDGIATYTGGSNYAKGILKSLKQDTKHRDLKIVLFIPKGFEPNLEDADLFQDGECEIRYLKKLKECDCSDVDVMFFPQVNGVTLRVIPKIKKRAPGTKICATLHDRQHNYYRFDWYDRFYSSGIKRTGIPGFIIFYLKRIVFAYEYRRCVGYIDKIFTVSNCSMQKLMHRNVKSIKYFIPENIVEGYAPKTMGRGNYILLVGGGRPEKNLLRTIEAFCEFKKQNETNTIFKVTGVTAKTKKNLLKKFKTDRDLIEKNIEFLPYITYQELAEIYAHCRYVVFTSKGEGYGLPVREAMSYGKTVLASGTTSVPEVAGAAICYVDPFSIDSICEGFKILEDKTILDRYEGYVFERNEILRRISRQDTEILIDELLGE